MPKLPFKITPKLLRSIRQNLKKKKHLPLADKYGEELVQLSVFGPVGVLGKRKVEKDIPHISDEVIKLRNHYLKSYSHLENDPAQINCGACLDFAKDLQHKVGGTVVGTKNGLHYWLLWKGKYYDSEIPYGVKRLEDIPLLPRWRKQTFRSFRRLQALKKMGFYDDEK